jgi:uncharacterized caspase-like protein
MEGADTAFQQQNYEVALQRYQQLLGSDLEPGERDHVIGRIATLNDLIAERIVRQTSSRLGSRPTLPEVQGAISMLNKELAYDTGNGKITAELKRLRDLGAGIELAIEQGIGRARTNSQRGAWNIALDIIDETSALDPSSGVFDAVRSEVLLDRHNDYLKRMREAYGNQDDEGLKVLLESARAQEPVVAGSLLTAIEDTIERLREDLLPAKIDQLVERELYYEAMMVLATSNRSSTKEQYQALRTTAAQFYLEDAQKALQAVPKLWGKAYFSAVKAYEFNADDPVILETYLRVNEHVDQLLQTKVGVAQFDSPEVRTRSGVQFTDGLISELNEQLPYGVSIADRAQLELLLQDRLSVRQAVFERESIDLLVRGNVSVLDVERKQSQTEDQLFIKVGEELVANPLYEQYLRQYGTSIRKWPENLQATPRQTYRDIKNQVSLKKTYQYAKGMMVISVSLIDARRNQVLRSFEDRESFFMEDTFHGAIPAAGIKEDPPELPSDFEIIEDMRKELAERVAGEILGWYAGREEKKAAIARQMLADNRLAEGLLWYAQAHKFCRESIADPESLAANPVYQEILGQVYLAHSEAKSVYDGVMLPGTAPVSPAVTDSRAAQAMPVSGDGLNKWALTIGITDYEDENIPDLNFAASDATAFHQWVTSPDGGGVIPERARLLVGSDATLTNIKIALSSWLRAAGKDDMVTIFLAGHGSPATPDNPEDIYFIPYDAKFDAIAATALSMDEFTEAFEKFIQAEQVVLLADACHSGAIGSGFRQETADGELIAMRFANIPAFRAESLVEDVVRSRGSEVEEGESGFRMAVLSSAKANQTSQESTRWQGGVFTQYLLEGMRSGADFNGDGTVTVEELYEFVSQSVERETNGRQQPVLSGQNFEDLVISRVSE